MTQPTNLIFNSLRGGLRAFAVLTLALVLPYEWTDHGLGSISITEILLCVILGFDALARMGMERKFSIGLVPQLIAALPLEIIFIPLGLLRLAYVPYWFFRGDARQQITNHFLLSAPIERAVISALGIVILVHWVACGWLVLGSGNPGTYSLSEHIDALYWTVVTMASVGYGDITPHNIPQKLYAIAVIFLGVGVYGYIIGNVTALLSSLDRAKEKHRERVAEMVSWLRFRGIPKSLQRRVVEHMHLLWDKRLSLDDSQMLTQLPPSLRAELATHLHSQLLIKVPLFQNAPMSFLSELATHLRPLVLQAGENICEKGHQGDEMYFISNGQVQVLDPSGKGVIATLSAGSFFGEIALLSQVPRTATVQTISLCELYSLRRDEFLSTLSLFPEFAEQVHTIAESRTSKLKA